MRSSITLVALVVVAVLGAAVANDVRFVLDGRQVQLVTTETLFTDACKSKNEQLVGITFSQLDLLAANIKQSVWVKSWSGDDYGGTVPLVFHATSKTVALGRNTDKYAALCTFNSAHTACQYETREWSRCSAACGKGTQVRTFVTTSGDPTACHLEPEVRECDAGPCPNGLSASEQCVQFFLGSQKVQYIPNPVRKQDACTPIDEKLVDITAAHLATLVKHVKGQAWIASWNGDKYGGDNLLAYTPPGSVNMWTNIARFGALCTSSLSTCLNGDPNTGYSPGGSVGNPGGNTGGNTTHPGGNTTEADCQFNTIRPGCSDCATVDLTIVTRRPTGNGTACPTPFQQRQCTDEFCLLNCRGKRSLPDSCAVVQTPPDSPWTLVDDAIITVRASGYYMYGTITRFDATLSKSANFSYSLSSYQPNPMPVDPTLVPASVFKPECLAANGGPIDLTTARRLEKPDFASLFGDYLSMYQNARYEGTGDVSIGYGVNRRNSFYGMHTLLNLTLASQASSLDGSTQQSELATLPTSESVEIALDLDCGLRSPFSDESVPPYLSPRQECSNGYCNEGCLASCSQCITELPEVIWVVPGKVWVVVERTHLYRNPQKLCENSYKGGAAGGGVKRIATSEYAAITEAVLNSLGNRCAKPAPSDASNRLRFLGQPNTYYRMSRPDFGIDVVTREGAIQYNRPFGPTSYLCEYPADSDVGFLIGNRRFNVAFFEDFTDRHRIADACVLVGGQAPASALFSPNERKSLNAAIGHAYARKGYAVPLYYGTILSDDIGIEGFISPYEAFTVIHDMTQVVAGVVCATAEGQAPPA